MKVPMISLCFLFLISSISVDSQCPCVLSGKAAYISKPASLSSGACGYEPLALSFSYGYLAAGVPSLFRDGVGCGACFKVKCFNETLCSNEGTTVILSDLNKDDKTDMVLSYKAFTAMAHKGKEQELLDQVVVDIQYERVPCVYKKNLAVRVDESSQYPHHLAIRFIYQGGLTEIFFVAVSQVGLLNWNSLDKNYGGLWSTSQVPPGPLEFKIVIQGGFDGMTLRTFNVLPADWKNGVLYDTSINITTIACLPC